MRFFPVFVCRDKRDTEKGESIKIKIKADVCRAKRKHAMS